MNILNTVKQAGLVLVIATLSVNSFAQDDERERGDRNFRGGINVERMTEALDLTPDQVVQVEELMASVKENISARREVEEAEREELRAAIEAQREEVQLALQGILTDEQYTQLQEFSDMRGNRGGKRDGKRSNKDEGGEA